jgi:ABC-type Mn2+/Zn2+ transport system ATPase subunit
VLEGVTLSIRRGAFVGIAGPNGAGKTTLLRGLLGLLPPLAGAVERRTRGFGYVPQRETLDPVYPLSVREVVEMGAYGRLSGLRRPTAADRELAVESLARVGLADRARARFAALSGGQRQRVLIARALVMKPDVLFLDEPTSGVDRQAEEAILALLRELVKEGVAVLLVSHHLTTLHEEVSELLWVQDGRVEQCDPRERLAPGRVEDLFVGGGGSGA